MYVKLSFDRVIRGETVSRSRVIPAKSVDLEIDELLEKGAFNFDTVPDTNVDEEVEAEFEAMLKTGDFSKARRHLLKNQLPPKRRSNEAQ